MMNRTIKFRGKRVDNGEWVYGGLWISYANDYYIIDSVWLNRLRTKGGKTTYGFEDEKQLFWVKRETVGQFIEETDTNDNELYEGDIIKYLDGEYETEDTPEEDYLVDYIVWGGIHHYPAFDLVNNHFEMNGIYEIWDGGFGVHKIGNIYDNPELLKGEQNEP